MDEQATTPPNLPSLSRPAWGEASAGGATQLDLRTFSVPHVILALATVDDALHSRPLRPPDGVG